MIPRTAFDTLARIARGFPVVALTGPRQSGKTTLARTSVRKWQDLAGNEACPPMLVFGGSGDYERQGCRVVGWRELTAEKL